MFQEVKNNVSFPQLEAEILEFWRDHRIYDQSLENRQDAPDFVFYEGPPTANGLPHPGHCLTRAIKDVFPRYKTMRGYRCTRKAGWDTHGLPVEVEVCKELGIHSKEEIEEYGIEPFIHRCQASVWRYMKEWERLTERLGFWIHLDEAYVTYHKSYVESVWWSLKELFNRGLLYQGHKIVWWWAQGGTALSSGEVGQGYREVADPSVFVKFPVVGQDNTSLLVWTTTPWTLPSNQFAAVHPDLQYATVVDGESGERLILAEALVETVREKAKRDWEVESVCAGRELLGTRYQPPFDYYAKDHHNQCGELKGGGEAPLYWKVVAADFVTTDSGTGVVHQAPAFGEVDYEVLIAEQERFAAGQGPELFCAIGPDGKFTDVAPEYQGQWVKDADKAISRRLKEEGKLFHLEQYLHDYPFCWRASEDPLIQYPRESWFIRTTKFRDSMLANNDAIQWLPEHIKQGRFGNFLESNVDWALSRERYWGTPLPIWVCESTGEMEAIGSYDELLAKPGVSGTEVWEKAKQQNPELPDDLQVHKPYIDEVTYDSPYADGSRMKRVSEVIDCWYDSGAMPFAQWGYPHQGQESFKSQFPADFISEALDQTRGWFYSQLAISTMLFGPEEGLASPQDALPEGARPWPHPFQNCIVLGLMLAEWWESPDGKQRFLTEDEARAACGTKYTKKVGKMSKQLRNYRSPQEIFDNYGADALRWYFFANQPPWNSIIYSDRAIRESIPEFMLRLWNVYSFFVIYANIDGFDPAQDFQGAPSQLNSEHLAGGRSYRSVDQRSELDRWVLSELQLMVGQVTTCMDAYDNYGACQAIESFLDGLSNWYVRRSRDRFWAKDVESVEKRDAYWTLYECLVTMSKVVAPFVPFVSETLWRNLTGVFGERVPASVHLCDYPQANDARRDDALSEQMALLREVASLGRSARMEAKLKVRQPLAQVEVILANSKHQGWLADHDEILASELNVKKVAFTQDAEQYINYLVQPNFKRVGPRVGKLMPKVKQWLTSAEGAALLAEMETQGHVTIEIDGQTIQLDGEDLEVRLQAKEGWAAAQGASSVVVLSTDLTDEMIREGLANDLIRLVQDRRKELNLEFTDRIQIGIETESEAIKLAIDENSTTIQEETLGMSLELNALDIEGVTRTVGESDVVLFVRVTDNVEAE